MDSTVVVALIGAIATVLTALVGSVAAAKLRREERAREAETRRAAEVEAHAELDARQRDDVLQHWRTFAAELQKDNDRLRAALRREEA